MEPLGTDAAAADDRRSRDTRSTSGAPRPPGYTDIWSGETNGPDGFTPLALAPPWTEKARLGTGVVGVMQRGPRAAGAAGRGARRRVRRPLRARHRRLVGPDRRGLERDAVREAPQSRSPRRSTSCAPALAGERTASGFKLETAPAERDPDRPRRAARQDAALAVEKADGAFTNFLPLSGLPQVDGAARRTRPEGFELLCRFFCLAGRARAGRADRPLHVLLLHHRPGLRELLPLARPRREDRPDGRGLGRQGPPEGRGEPRPGT